MPDVFANVVPATGCPHYVTREWAESMVAIGQDVWPCRRCLASGRPAVAAERMAGRARRTTS